MSGDSGVAIRCLLFHRANTPSTRKMIAHLCAYYVVRVYRHRELQPREALQQAPCYNVEPLKRASLQYRTM